MPQELTGAVFKYRPSYNKQKRFAECALIEADSHEKIVANPASECSKFFFLRQQSFGLYRDARRARLDIPFATCIVRGMHRHKPAQDARAKAG
jgi:hypothetical protein